MRMGRWPILWLTVVLLVACGADGPMAPEPCSELEDVRLYTGEQESVTLCYLGDDGQLSVDVVSSDREIVDLTYRPDTRVVGLFARSPGLVTVTITAYGEADLVSEQEFRVSVPNRSPEVAGELPPATMVPMVRQEWELGGLFDEPDGQALQYTATSSNPAVAMASVAETVLAVAARAVGVAEITVTASDGELSASVVLALEVRQVSVVYSETFDGGLNGWEALTATDFSRRYGEWGPYVGSGGSNARTRYGALEVWSDRDVPARGVAAIEQGVQYFDLRAKLQPAPRGSGTVASLVLLVDSDWYPQIEFMLIDDRYPGFESPQRQRWWMVWALNARQQLGGVQVWEEWARGHFNGDPAEFADVRWWYESEDGRYRIEFGGQRVTIPSTESGHPGNGRRFTSPHLKEVALVAHHIGSRSGEAGRVRLGETTIRGVLVGASTSRRLR